MKYITQTSVTGEVLYSCKKLWQLVKKSSSSAECRRSTMVRNDINVRHTDTQLNATYISQKQSYYKMELRCDFNYEMLRAHVRCVKTTVRSLFMSIVQRPSETASF